MVWQKNFSNLKPHPRHQNDLIMFDFSRKKQLPLKIVANAESGELKASQSKTSSQPGLFSESLKLVRDIILVLAVFILLGVFVAQPVIVEGTSMLPVLHDGERLLVNKLVYYKIQSADWGHIERGDVVVFWYPKDPEKSYVKRVVGLPGETIEVRNGVVLIDGEEMREDYIDTDFNQTQASFPPRKIDEHYYYVMGDNRDNSADSRYWGLVPEKYIYGKVFFRYWQPSNMGFLSKGHYELNEENIGNVRAVEADSPNR